jgi:hypothetical protein
VCQFHRQRPPRRRQCAGLAATGRYYKMQTVRPEGRRGGSCLRMPSA